MILGDLVKSSQIAKINFKLFKSDACDYKVNIEIYIYICRELIKNVLNKSWNILLANYIKYKAIDFK